MAAKDWTPCDPNCDGWAVFECDGSEDPRTEIQRCDACDRFEDDDAAAAHVANLVGQLVGGELLYVHEDRGEVELRNRFPEEPEPDDGSDPSEPGGWQQYLGRLEREDEATAEAMAIDLSDAPRDLG